MESIEKEPAVDVGSSGAAADVGSSRPPGDVGSSRPPGDVGSAGPAADVGSSEPPCDVGSLEPPGDVGKKVEKVLKGKQKIMLEETKSSNEGEHLKSHVYGTLHSRMSPSSIVQVVEKCLENQLKASRAIGFGSMEFLKVTQLPLQLGLWLVHHFDANTCSLNIPDSDPFCITEEHVHQVLGLPMGGIEIDKNNFSRDKKVIEQFKKQFKSNSFSIKIGELKEFLKEHKSAGPMFKRNFVVLCVSTLMDGKQNVNINYDILTFLSDVDKIKDLNWCKYILDSLVKAKLFWQERQTRSFPGSLLFLMLLYVDQFVIEEVRAKRETPILKGWTTNMLSSREKLEIFNGRLVGPCSKQPKMEQSDPIYTKNEEIEQDPKKKCLMELATASTNLVLAYMDFHEKHEIASKYFPNNEKILKLKEDAMTICDEQKINSKAFSEDIPLSFSQDEQYWQDPVVIEAWDMFSKMTGNDTSGVPIEPESTTNDVVKKVGESTIRYNLRSSIAKGSGIPSFSLGLSSQEIDSQEKSHSNSPIEEPVVAPVSAHVVAAVGDDADASNAQEDAITLKRKGDAEIERCIPNKRKVQPSLRLRSPFKSRIIDIHTPLTTAQKGVIDSFFHEKKNRFDAGFLCEGEPNREVKLFQLEMLKSQSKIHRDVINAWSTVLNFNEQYRDMKSRGHFFFGLNAVDCLFQYESDRAQERNKMFCEVVDLEFSKTIIPKKDIELFFFPVFEKDHYYMICFNTTTDCGTIEVIDYSEGAEENKKLLKNLKSAFSYFINGEGSTQSVVWSKQIKSMEFVLVDLPWKSLDDHHLHCGVAMMRHMETYMGSQKWNSGLKKNNDVIIEKLHLKYTLSIISSEANIVKPVKQVVQKKKKSKEANDSE